MTNNNSVNRRWVEIPLWPLAGLGDAGGEDSAPFEDILPHEKARYLGVIQEHILPYMARIDAASMEKLKRSLAYYLNLPDTPWGAICETLYMPFENPEDPRDFFLWIWEEAFPGESWAVNVNNFEVNDDITEPQRSIRLSPRASTTG